MLKTANYQRFVIIVMNPQQKYESMHAIKLEIADTIKSLAPSYAEAEQVAFIYFI